jgi:hypothetical protein
MRKLLLVSIAVISLMAGAFAAIGGQSTPALAAAADYGAGAYTGSNPIGGGDGYASAHGYSQDTADYVVTNATGLRNALAAAISGQVVWIPGSAVIDISSSSGTLTVPAGVALASDRGKGGSPGGLINFGRRGGIIFSRKSNSVVSGLRFYGANSTGSAWVLQSSYSVHTEVENCEVANGGGGGIGFMGDNIPWNSGWATGSDQKHHWVHHCYIHGFSLSGLGYGIWVNNSGVLIECNMIGDCRHLFMGNRTSSSSSGYDTNYEARYNDLTDSSSNTQVDCHGGNDTTAGGWGPSPVAVPGDHAGGTLKIHHNTFSNNNGRLNVGIRGIPGETCEVYHNWTKHTTHSGLYTETNPANSTFKQYLGNLVGKTFNGSTITGSSFINMSVHDNWYGSTPPPLAPYTNHAPVLEAVGGKSVAAGTTLSFTISAYDPDGDSLAFSASNLPSGATFSASSRALSWTPDSSQGGTHSGVRFQVSDGSLTDSEEIAISVTVAVTGSTIDPDINSDGTVNSLDMIRVGQHWAETGAIGWIREDINRDGSVSVLDATLVGQNWTG